MPYKLQDIPALIENPLKWLHFQVSPHDLVVCSQNVYVMVQATTC